MWTTQPHLSQVLQLRFHTCGQLDLHHGQTRLCQQLVWGGFEPAAHTGGRGQWGRGQRGAGSGPPPPTSAGSYLAQATRVGDVILGSEEEEEAQVNPRTRGHAHRAAVTGY